MYDSRTNKSLRMSQTIILNLKIKYPIKLDMKYRSIDADADDVRELRVLERYVWNSESCILSIIVNVDGREYKLNLRY